VVSDISRRKKNPLSLLGIRAPGQYSLQRSRYNDYAIPGK